MTTDSRDMFYFFVATKGWNSVQYTHKINAMQTRYSILEIIHIPVILNYS